MIHSYRGLKSEQDKLNTIILSSLEGIVVTDSGGNIVFVNPVATRLVGKTEAQIRAGGFLNILNDPELIFQNLCQDPSELTPKLVEYNTHMLEMLGSSILAPSGRRIASIPQRPLAWCY